MEPAITVRSVVVEWLSHVRLSATSWTVAHQVLLSFTVSQSLLKFMSIDSVMLLNHLFLCHSLLLLPSIISALGPFPMSQLFTLGGQSIGVQV